MDNGELGVYEINKAALPTIEEFASDVIDGLSCQKKNLKSKYFYDKRGSSLFEQICLQPEYYITRTETDILRLRLPELVSLFSEDISILELGSGNACKTR